VQNMCTDSREPGRSQTNPCVTCGSRNVASITPSPIFPSPPHPHGPTIVARSPPSNTRGLEGKGNFKGHKGDKGDKGDKLARRGPYTPTEPREPPPTAIATVDSDYITVSRPFMRLILELVKNAAPIIECVRLTKCPITTPCNPPRKRYSLHLSAECGIVPHRISTFIRVGCRVHEFRDVHSLAIVGVADILHEDSIDRAENAASHAVQISSQATSDHTLFDRTHCIANRVSGRPLF
jgi:hypothetical protein